MMAIDREQLANAQGGMNLDGFRRSTNIEDRRSEPQVLEDDQWMGTLKSEQAGKDLANALRDRQIADQWRRSADELLRAGAR